MFYKYLIPSNEQLPSGFMFTFNYCIKREEIASEITYPLIKQPRVFFVVATFSMTHTNTFKQDSKLLSICPCCYARLPPLLGPTVKSTKFI